MKKSIILILAAAALLPSCAQKISDAIGNTTADFSGKPLETREIPLTDFRTIQTAAGIRLTVVRSAERKIIIKSNVAQLVEATVKGGELSVHYNSRGTSITSATTEATVYTPDFAGLDASSAARISVGEGFRFEKLTVAASSAGRISGNFEASEIAVDASSAAHFSGKVQAEKLSVDASSGAHIELSGFAREVSAEASSSAKIDLAKLKFSTIQKDESSSGKILTK